jgi:hypothetical protein
MSTQNPAAPSWFFTFPYAKTGGFVGSILKLMDLDLPVPDHTTLSRRNRTVEVRKRITDLPDGPMCFIVDSTGLKICGDGEWHTKKHGEKRRKRWKKLHIAVDEDGRILASKVTDSPVQDPSQVPDLLDQFDKEIDYGSVSSRPTARPTSNVSFT